MIVECPGCSTIFPVDPQKVPTAGIHARCSVCSEVFFVEVPVPDSEPVDVETSEIPEEESFLQSEVEVEEEEPAFEEPMPTYPDTGPTVGEAGATSGESESTFGEAEETLEEAEPAFEEAEDTFEEAEEVAEEAEDTFGEIEATVDETADDPGEDVPEGPSLSGPLFGKRDPQEKAQRLARVLVSDIILYNPDRHHDATESGQVKEEFEEEIQKSWNEYVEQVGEEVANSTNFFNDALNEILAKGEQVF